jgi:hypothetical protein
MSTSLRPATPVAEVISKLQDAGDGMLAAVIYHSDHLELSEQFDGVTGYEKSVKNLTWSYAAFLSAVRARTGQGVEGEARWISVQIGSSGCLRFLSGSAVSNLSTIAVFGRAEVLRNTAKLAYLAVCLLNNSDVIFQVIFGRPVRILARQ